MVIRNTILNRKVAIGWYCSGLLRTLFTFGRDFILMLSALVEIVSVTKCICRKS